MDSQSAGITVKRLAGALGAEIAEINLSEPGYGNSFPDIQQAFLDHAVLVVRKQQLAPDQLVAFSKNFGALESHVLESFNLPENPEVLVISNVKEDGKPIGAINAGQYWHSDLSYMQHPTQASLLHAQEVPSYGGDTMFTSMTQAYDELSPSMKTFLEGLTAIHDYTNAYDTFFCDIPDRPPLSDEVIAKVPPVEHPIVRTHPETGNKALFINPGFTRKIKQLTAAESRNILDFLFTHCQQPHLTYRHIWAPGDLLIWDNRCTCHLAIADYDMNEHRHLLRTSVEGDVPS
jgi:taurine dioxygenase